MLVSRCFPTRIPGTLGFIGTPLRVPCKFLEIILYNKKNFAVVTVHIIMSRLASHIIHYNWWHTVFLNAIYFGNFVLEWLYYSPICIGIQLILSSNLVLFVLACIQLRIQLLRKFVLSTNLKPRSRFPDVLFCEIWDNNL